MFRALFNFACLVSLLLLCVVAFLWTRRLKDHWCFSCGVPGRSVVVAASSYRTVGVSLWRPWPVFEAPSFHRHAVTDYSDVCGPDISITNKGGTWYSSADIGLGMTRLDGRANYRIDDAGLPRWRERRPDPPGPTRMICIVGDGWPPPPPLASFTRIDIPYSVAGTPLAAMPACWVGARAAAAGRRRRRARRGLCPRCGYDLRGSNERCPECGRAVSYAAGGV